MGWNCLSIPKCQPLKFADAEVNSPTRYNGCNYLSMLELKLINVSNRWPWDHLRYIPRTLHTVRAFLYSVVVRWWSIIPIYFRVTSLQWRHDECDGVSNHRRLDCLLSQRKHQSSASLAFVRGIHWWPLDSPHKGPVTRKMFPFGDVIIFTGSRPTIRYLSALTNKWK